MSSKLGGARSPLPKQTAHMRIQKTDYEFILAIVLVALMVTIMNVSKG